jgi:hypothetical protein
LDSTASLDVKNQMFQNGVIVIGLVCAYNPSSDEERDDPA